MENTEQIRSLINNVHLAGMLAELKITEGKTQKGVPYISLKGAIQCDQDPVYTVRFESFAQKYKTDGTDNKQYINIRDWAKSAVPMTKDKENCTFVKAYGSLGCNDYVNRNGKLVQDYRYILTYFTDFKEYEHSIDFEGFVYSITDEVKGEDSEYTGRKLLRIIGKENIGNNIIDLKNVVIDDEIKDLLDENNFEPHCTAVVFINLLPSVKAEKKEQKGFGKQRSTDGTVVLNMVMEGGKEPIELGEKGSLSMSVIKAGMNVRKEKLQQLEAEGYKGSSSGNSDKEESKPSFGKSHNSDNFETLEDDDEIPF